MVPSHLKDSISDRSFNKQKEEILAGYFGEDFNIILTNDLVLCAHEDVFVSLDGSEEDNG